jgi:hypothetical protein
MRRFVQGTLVLVVAMVLVGSGRAAQGPRAANTSGVSNDWTVPRTPWGHPDLQGVWTTDAEIGVPVERRVDLGDKAVLTDQEFEQRAQRLKKRYADNREDRVKREGTTGDGPEHWYEGGRTVSRRTSLVIDPPNGRMPEYTAEAKTRKVPPGTELGFVGGSMGKGPWNGPEDLHLADRCITRGLPQTWFPSEYNNGFQIVQSRDYVTILPERLHEARVIPLDGRPHLTSNIRQWFGDSRAHWEGDSLVVEVTNFSDRTSFRKSGSTLRLTERYTRTAPDTVRVEVTIDDPSTWVKPWTFAVTGKKDPTYWQIFEYACHEGNYAMRHILSGARAQEKAAAEKTNKSSQNR